MHPADLVGPLVFVEDLDAPRLSDEDRHHLERVLRTRPGASISVADGHGRWRPAVLDRDIGVQGRIEEESPLTPTLAVGFALVKGARPDLIVQKLTELGIDRIVPFHAERSIVRWDGDKAARAVSRLRAVARAAAMQCRRPRLPVVEELAELSSLVLEPGAAMADRDGAAPALEHSLLLVGPEGGWSPAEREIELPRVSFGRQVLRAETASITAGVLLTALRAGLIARIS